MDPIVSVIARRLDLPEGRVAATVKLLAEGATIPFISRYRKEATGGLDEVAVGAIETERHRLGELEERKRTILTAIEGQGALTGELRGRIAACFDAAELEDLYLPYKPHRRTRADIARSRGLEPLADLLLAGRDDTDPRRFVRGEVADAEAALQGARDIVAERINTDPRARSAARSRFGRGAVVTSHVVKGKEEQAAKYKDYFDFGEPLRRCSSHRLLAMRRGETEGLLRVSIAPADSAAIVDGLRRQFVRGHGRAAAQVAMAADDAYKRLLRPSLEAELAAESKQRADVEAIRVFSENLSQLLLAAPLGGRRVMGIDPGFRTGCKVVCLDEQGGLLHHETVFPHPPQSRRDEAGRRLAGLVERYGVEAIAVGSGTAGRETEEFLRSLPALGAADIFMVSEDGASVYSASAVAREEFPDCDVTVRGAVSIARRLMDPLAELVKIDPKAIGVGQYQHDVDQRLLRASLDRTVERCVNAVGVDLNTASRHLLTYVSGLTPALARNIVDHRAQHGPFTSRRELLAVPRLGPKAYEQCAGFLRIRDAKNPLDSTAVHPERYGLVERMAADAGCTVAELIGSRERRQGVDLNRYVTPDVGLPTLTDIMAELDKPGRDPRGTAAAFAFDPALRTLDDVRPGMELEGIVTNVTDFGCFVDLGIKVKGLVHVSQLADHYVPDPTAVVRLHARVRVRVLDVDRQRQRISLTMRGL